VARRHLLGVIDPGRRKLPGERIDQIFKRSACWSRGKRYARSSAQSASVLWWRL